VSASSKAVDALVARVFAEAGKTGDPSALRRALACVLRELDVVPGDPAWADGRDVIGAAYERLLPGRARRELGQFFTPLWIGRVMARWLLQEHPRLLLDPGCGSGSLLAAVAHERRGATRLLGLDIDPLAIAMSESNRALRAIDHLELRHADFLLDDLKERPSAVICNPPYTRHHALAPSVKKAIHAGFQKRLGIEFSHLASLHVLFLVRALEVAADDGRLAFITPAHWLDMNYARAVKEFLLGQAHVEAIIRFPASELLFEHAVTTTTVTLIRKGTDAASPTKLLRAANRTTDSLLAALGDPDAGERAVLSSASKWSRRGRRRETTGVVLEEVASVRRGLATGCNAFFVLSERDRRDFELDRSYLQPCIASPRLFAADEIDEQAMAALPKSAPRWLLTPARQWQHGPLARYLAHGIALGVLERYLVEQRVNAGRPWWRVENNFKAPILFSYFNRRRPHFVRNRVGGVPLNNWLVIQPREGINYEALFAALREPAVRRRLEGDSRQYGNGLWKLEPSELKKLRLPTDIQSLRQS